MDTKEATLYEIKTTTVRVDPCEGFKTFDAVVANTGEPLLPKSVPFNINQKTYPIRKWCKYLNVDEHLRDPINVELKVDNFYFLLDESAEEFSINTLDYRQEDLKNKVKDAAVKYNRLIEEEKVKVHTWFSRLKYLLTNDKKHLT